MDNQDRDAIGGLFARLAEVERQAGPRDGEADAFIRERIAAQPGAPYFMAQTIVVQGYALDAAQRRIEALEAQIEALAAEAEARPAAGGFLSGLFGGGAAPARPAPRTVPSIGSGRGTALGSGTAAGAGLGAAAGMAAPPPGSFGSAEAPARPAGGGFLAGAAQTAMGVAGGILLGNMIGGLFAGDATAAEAPAEPAAAPDPVAEDTGADDVPADDEGGGFFDSLFGDDEI